VHFEIDKLEKMFSLIDQWRIWSPLSENTWIQWGERCREDGNGQDCDAMPGLFRRW